MCKSEIGAQLKDMKKRVSQDQKIFAYIKNVYIILKTKHIKMHTPHK